MNAKPDIFVVGLVRDWVRLYTLGLPSDVSRTRRDEIDSDLWEQTKDIHISDPNNFRFSLLHILVRLMMGIPDDLLWRMEQYKSSKKSGSTAGGNRFMRFATILIRPRAYLNLAAVLIAMFILFPIGIGAFVAAVVAVVVPLALISAPVSYRFNDMSIGPFVIDTFGEAVVTSIIGFILLFGVLYVANAIVAVLGRFVSLQIGRFQVGNKA